jgi:hypothetical protein
MIRVSPEAPKQIYSLDYSSANLARSYVMIGHFYKQDACRQAYPEEATG